jgi:hypothetical protein
MALLFLSFAENIQNRFTGIMRIFGRTAFFYYLLHIIFVHIATAILFFSRGHSMHDAVGSMQTVPFLFVIPGEGYGLGVVYGVWLAVVLALYPLCKWYDSYKTNHREKWWLSYL